MNIIDRYTYTERAVKPLNLKLNPIWWLKNDDEQKLDDGTTDWYRPGQPQWLRRLAQPLNRPCPKMKD
jgi:hypothetical protein